MTNAALLVAVAGIERKLLRADAATLAASLIPEPARGYESGSDHFFRQSSRTFLESLLQVAARANRRAFPSSELNREIEAGPLWYPGIQPDRSERPRAGRRDCRDGRQRDAAVPVLAARRRASAVERARMVGAA